MKIADSGFMILNNEFTLNTVFLHLPIIFLKGGIMKHFIATTFFLFSLISFIIADVELGIDFGYGFPFNTFQDDFFLPSAEFQGIETDTSMEYSEYKDLYYSLGKGLKAGIDFSIYLNDNVGIYFSSGFSFVGVYNDIEQKYTYEGEKSKYNTSIKANFLPINVGLKLKSGTGKVSPYVYIAPGLYIPIGVNGEAEYEEGGVTDKATYKIKYAPGFGIASGIGLKINLSDAFGFKFEFAPTLASARVKEAEAELDGEKYTYIFKKNEADLPEDTNDTYYYHGGPKHSFSSLSAKIGVLIGF